MIRKTGSAAARGAPKGKAAVKAAGRAAGAEEPHEVGAVASARNLAREVLGFAAWALACAALFSVSLWMVEHDWEHGRMRSGLILLCALGVFALRWPWRPLRAFASRAMVGIAIIIAAIALVADARIGMESVSHARETSEIRLDQGQNLLRSAQLLARGENPYGRGALVDLEAFNTRLRLRAQLGMAPRMHPVALRPALFRYSREPEHSLAQQLFPEPPPGSAPEQAAEAEREYSLLGHKYGPLPLLITRPFLRAGPAAIPALQLAAFLGWLAALIWLLRAPALRLAPAAVPLAIALVLLEPHVAHNYLYDSASDAWVLGFCALALGAHLRGLRALTGFAIALALGCKLFPAALFVPLLFTKPMRRALLACAAALALLYLPFFLWDPRGLWLNLVAWPSLMEPDNTGWLAYFPALAPIARAVSLAVIAGLSAIDLFGLRVSFWRPFARFVPVDPARAPAHFALVSACAILAGSAFHNNYVPWVSSWGFVALAIAFGSAGNAVVVEGGSAALPGEGSASAG